MVGELELRFNDDVVVSAMMTGVGIKKMDLPSEHREHSEKML